MMFSQGNTDPSAYPAEIPVAIATPISDHDVGDPSDAEAEVTAAAAREQGTEMIRDHLDSHLRLNPGSSYVTWIAALHPENATVAIDPRFMISGNPWLTVYKEAQSDMRKNNSGRGTDAGVVAAEEGGDAPAPAGSSTVGEEGQSYGGFLDLVLGMALMLTAVSVAFSLEIVGLYVYVSAVICHKIYKACSDPRVTVLSALPYAICCLLYQIFRFLDVIMLFLSVLVVELIAAINFFICALLSLNWRVGKAAHQRTRRWSHLTRWAFRRPFQWGEPRRSSWGCSPNRSGASDTAGGEEEEVPTLNEEKAQTPATVAPIPAAVTQPQAMIAHTPATFSEKEMLYDS